MSDTDKNHIYDVIQHWKNESIVNERSLFWQESLWNIKNLVSVQKDIILPALKDDTTNIEDSLPDKLKKCSEEAAALTCEIFYIYALFPLDIDKSLKKKNLEQIAQWGDVQLPTGKDMEEFLRAFQTGCGYAGQNYRSRMMEEWLCLTRIAETVLVMSKDRREEIFFTPRLLEETVIKKQDSKRTIPFILAHLLFPDNFDTIVIPQHKHRISAAFRSLSTNKGEVSAGGIITSVQQALKPYFEKHRPDFYKSPLSEFWLGDGEDMLDFSISEKLRTGKQIILYGPTGGGKRLFARQIAEMMIRRSLLEKFNMEWYFSRLNEMTKIINDRIIHVPLYKDYNYNNFIRDPLNKGMKGYGTLLKICSFLQEKNPENVRKIPFVVILDNFHSINPSTLFGETFPLLRDREQRVLLRGDDQMLFSLPDNLYLIATMNPAIVTDISPFLRGRFLWFLCAFDPLRLLKSLAEKWEQNRKNHDALPPWGHYIHEFNNFAYNAQKLNDIITEQPELGVNYQISDNYLLHIINFAQEHLAIHGAVEHLLYDKNGTALAPIEALWNHILKPFFNFYEEKFSAKTVAKFLQKSEDSFLKSKKTSSTKSRPSNNKAIEKQTEESQDMADIEDLPEDYNAAAVTEEDDPATEATGSLKDVLQEDTSSPKVAKTDHGTQDNPDDEIESWDDVLPTDAPMKSGDKTSPSDDSST